MTPALVALIAVLAIAAYWYFGPHARAKMLTGLSMGVQLVQVGAYNRLKKRFAPRFPPETASYLAAAVVNALFSRAAQGEGTAFRAHNEALIANEFAELKDDPELCQTVWQAVIAACVVTYETTPKASRDLRAAYRPRQALKDSGLVADTNPLIRMDFLDMAVRFADQNKATGA